MLIGVLALLWLAVLTPPLLRARAHHRTSGDLTDYYTSLSRLGRHQRRGRPVVLAGGAPMTAARTASPRMRAAQRRATMRRRRVFTTLVSAVGATFVLGALSSSRIMWLLCGMCLAALLAYTALVAHFQRAAQMPVVPLATVSYLRVPTAPRRELAYRRTVNS